MFNHHQTGVKRANADPYWNKNTSTFESLKRSYLDPRLIAPEGSALPLPPRNKLEGACRDLLASRRHTDNDGLSPAPVGALEGRPHHFNVTDALKLTDIIWGGCKAMSGSDMSQMTVHHSCLKA